MAITLPVVSRLLKNVVSYQAADGEPHRVAAQGNLRITKQQVIQSLLRRLPKSAQVIFNLSINAASSRLLLSIQLDVKCLGKTEDLFVVCGNQITWNSSEICCHKWKKERVCLALQKAWNRRKQEVWWTPFWKRNKKSQATGLPVIISGRSQEWY